MTIPFPYHAVTPYLICNDGARAIDFYKEAFDAEETFRLTRPDGLLSHAELKIGDSVLMLSEISPNGAENNKNAREDYSIALLLYVEDVDAQFAKAVGKGAEIIRPVQDQFYGDRTCTLKDPSGQIWIMATHKEDLTPEQIKSRSDSLFERIPQD